MRAIADVKAAFAFMARLLAPDDWRLELWIGTKNVLTLSDLQDVIENEGPDSYTKQLVDDLAVIASRFMLDLHLPGELTYAQRAEIRKCRLVVDGHVIEEPDFAALTVNFKPDAREAIDPLLDDNGFTLAYSSEIRFLVEGHQLPIQACIFHPRLTVANPDHILAALERSDGKPIEVQIKGRDGTPFRLYEDGRNDRDPNEPLVAAPLEIAGFESPA